MSTGRWTSADIPNLHGLVAVVTGANSGLGLHTCLELARHGATVVMACRDTGRAATALQRVREQVPAAQVEVQSLDLADLASVRTFAADLSSSHPQIDLLVNNAGVMAPPQRRTSADGFELQLATNHLGHFALTGLLLPALLSGSQRERPSRVVTVSSMAHRPARIDLDDLQSEHHYQSWKAYGQSKLANLLFTFQLQRFVDAAALDLVSVASHPGVASTELMMNRSPNGGGIAKIMTRAMRLLSQSSAAGAEPSLMAATAPGVRGAEFFGPSSFGGWRGPAGRTTAAAAAYDVPMAEALWQRSSELTGVDYPTSI